MPNNGEFSFDLLTAGMRQASDAAAQSAQQMREQFRTAAQDIDASVRQQLANEIRARQQHSVEIQKITSTTVRDQTQQWNSVFTTVNRGFANSVTSMSNSSRTLQQNIARVLDQILADFLRMLERMVANWVAQHVFMQVFGIGAQKATSAASIESSAAEGAAAAYASAAAIPVVGWSMAPAIAADAYSNILGFEALNAFAAGGIVPDDALAFVHKNEMVLPASLSSGLSQMISSDDSGSNNMHINFSVSATDSKSFEGRLHDHADTLVRVIKRAWRHGKF
jgi:hypothetical protein